MCVVVYKPKNKKMPKKETLYSCFVTNPDGAGYMFQKGDKVKIKKGFMTFLEFYESLMKDYGEVGKKADFVLHFRISTQGGVNRPLCHPYPMSKVMDKLKELDCESNLGVAHNGIISLTTEYSYKDWGRSWGINGYYNYGDNYYKEPDYNDTMKFITDYLSLIMKSENDVFDEDKVEIVEKLIGSSNKLAIMTPNNVNLIGTFFEKDGIFYSNTYSWSTTTYSNKNDKNKDTEDYSEIIQIEDYTEEDPEKKDYSEHLGCGYADKCRKCTRFTDCYGFDFPENWEVLSDSEVDKLIDYYMYGVGDEKEAEEIEERAESLYWLNK